MELQPYVFFDGRCEEAIEFYRKALGAEITMLLRYKDCPEPAANMPAPAEKIMHANLRIGGATLLASDGHSAGQPNFQRFGLALSVDDEATADRFFTALSDGGQVRMPLGKTFFSPKFGMVADKFGVLWMVMVGT